MCALVGREAIAQRRNAAVEGERWKGVDAVLIVGVARIRKT